MDCSSSIVLAGIARSGSTLVCHLLNKSNNIVALHEPIIPSSVPFTCEKDTVDYIKQFFEQQRESISLKKIAKSCSSDGKVPDNHVGELDANTGKRIILLNGREITIKKTLDKNFSLLIKQPGLFTALLHILKNHFPCYATVRNPLAVLRSWNSVDMAVTNGHAPAAEDRDPTLKSALAEEDDVYRRQLILLSWYYEKFYHHLDKNKIIRYENVISSGGKCLSNICSSALQLNEKLNTKNNNVLYSEAIKHQLAERLLDSDGYYWKYYSKQDVNVLLK